MTRMSPAVAPAVPSPLVCGLWLALVRTAVKVLGFGRSVRATRRWSERAPLLNEPPAGVVARTARAVAMAGAFFPGRAICLEQSLTLYLLLRRRGIPVELRIGVQPYPFHAHAWVEFEGEPVNEEAEVVRQFVLLPEIAR